MAVSLDTSDWFRVKAELDRFDPALTRAMRVKMKLRTDAAVNAVKDKLREATPEGNPSGPGRDALIAGTRATISFSKHMAGARIVTSGSRLPEAHAALLKVYNLASFRHPVFESGRQRTTRTFTGSESARQRRQRVGSGELAAWVEEQGNPYFDKVIKEHFDRNLERDMNTMLDEAIASIGAR